MGPELMQYQDVASINTKTFFFFLQEIQQSYEVEWVGIILSWILFLNRILLKFFWLLGNFGLVTPLTLHLRSGPGGGTPPKVRGGGWEELPHARGQGQRPGGATPCPRSGGCMGAGGPRGATPRSRSGGAAVRRHPSSKVRSSGCALLEQPWRDTPHPR